MKCVCVAFLRPASCSSGSGDQIVGATIYFDNLQSGEVTQLLSTMGHHTVGLKLHRKGDRSPEPGQTWTHEVFSSGTSEVVLVSARRRPRPELPPAARRSPFPRPPPACGASRAIPSPEFTPLHSAESAWLSLLFHVWPVADVASKCLSLLSATAWEPAHAAGSPTRRQNL